MAAAEFRNGVRWEVSRWRESVYQACPGAPVQAGSSCDRCGQSIRYVVTLKSTAGDTMDVGQDCAVTLHGGPELAEIRAAERRYAEEMYRATPEYQARERERRDREKERADRAATVEARHPLLLSYLRAIIASPNVAKFQKGFAEDLESRLVGGQDVEPGEFDDDTLEALKLGASLACLPAVSEYAAPVGAKIDRDVLVEAMIPIETAYGRTYVQKFRSRAGEALVWFSKGGDLGPVHVGQWVHIRGTVKGHDIYQGVKQTKMIRCKVTDVA
jgi:hypothetical protein